MTKKEKEQTTTITLTMSQYNELEGVISNAHFGGYYYRLKEEQPQDVKTYKELYDKIMLAGDDFDDMFYDNEFVGITAEDEIVEPKPEVF